MSIDQYQQLYSAWDKTPGIGISSADSRKGIEEFLRRNPEGCFIACSGEEIIGGILAGNDGRRGYLYHLFVSPGYRHKGVATSLVNRALEHLASIGIEKSHVFVFSDNTGGREFWIRQGWDERNDITVYSRNHFGVNGSGC